MSLFNPNPQAIKEVLEREVRERIDEILQEEAEKAAREVTRRINALADSIALNLLRRYSVERMGDDVFIRVHKAEE